MLLSYHVVRKTAFLRGFYSRYKLLGITAFAQLFFLFLSIPISHTKEEKVFHSNYNRFNVHARDELSFLPAKKRKGSILLGSPSPNHL